jgi:hypothetical protein
MDLDPVPTIAPEPPDHSDNTTTRRRRPTHPICPYLSPDASLVEDAEVAYLAEKALVRTKLLANSSGPQDPEAFERLVAHGAQHRLGT